MSIDIGILVPEISMKALFRLSSSGGRTILKGMSKVATRLDYSLGASLPSEAFSMSSLTLKGACLSAALLVAGAFGTSPASAQSVHIDIGVNGIAGYDENVYDRPYHPRPHRSWRGHHPSYEGGWEEGYRYYAYAGPRCTTKIVRYYDEFEGASVTKRIRRCR
jgi:hypothetical protein